MTNSYFSLRSLYFAITFEVYLAHDPSFLLSGMWAIFWWEQKPHAKDGGSQRTEKACGPTDFVVLLNTWTAYLDSLLNRLSTTVIWFSYQKAGVIPDTMPLINSGNFLAMYLFQYSCYGTCNLYWNSPAYVAHVCYLRKVITWVLLTFWSRQYSSGWSAHTLIREFIFKRKLFLVLLSVSWRTHKALLIYTLNVDIFIDETCGLLTRMKHFKNWFWCWN